MLRDLHARSYTLAQLFLFDKASPSLTRLPVPQIVEVSYHPGKYNIGNDHIYQIPKAIANTQLGRLMKKTCIRGATVASKREKKDRNNRKKAHGLKQGRISNRCERECACLQSQFHKLSLFYLPFLSPGSFHLLSTLRMCLWGERSVLILRSSPSFTRREIRQQEIGLSLHGAFSFFFFFAPKLICLKWAEKSSQQKP